MGMLDNIKKKVLPAVGVEKKSIHPPLQVREEEKPTPLPEQKQPIKEEFRKVTREDLNALKAELMGEIEKVRADVGGLAKLSTEISEQNIKVQKLIEETEASKTLPPVEEVKELREEVEKLKRQGLKVVPQEFTEKQMGEKTIKFIKEFDAFKKEKELELDKLYDDIKSVSNLMEGIEKQNSRIHNLIQAFDQRIEKLSSIVTDTEQKLISDKNKMVKEQQEFLMKELGNWKKLKESMLKFSNRIKNCEDKLFDFEDAFRKVGEIKRELHIIRSETEVIKKLRAEMTIVNKSLTKDQINLKETKDSIRRKSESIEKRIDKMEGILLNQRFQINQKVYSLLIFNTLSRLNNLSEKNMIIGELNMLETLVEEIMKKGYWDNNFEERVEEFLMGLSRSWQSENQLETVNLINDSISRIKYEAEKY